MRKDFLDYLFGGLELNINVAIDFTSGSMGSSRHTYEQALTSCTTPLLPYSSSKKIAVYGFGAQPLRNLPVSTCFALTNDIFKPEVAGVKGLLEAFARSVD